jgi:RNA polymerase sigma-70 factor (ECF subfamily)
MWPDSLTTDELLDRARDGDVRSRDQLLDRHRQALLQLVRHRLDRRISARVDASDVVQDVLLEASRRLSEYLLSPGLPFHLWLRGLARDRMIDVHRRPDAASAADREHNDRAAPGNLSGVDLMGRLAICRSPGGGRHSP